MRASQEGNAEHVTATGYKEVQTAAWQIANYGVLDGREGRPSTGEQAALTHSAHEAACRQTKHRGSGMQLAGTCCTACSGLDAFRLGQSD